MSEKNFGQLGETFQKSLLKTIIEDKKFGITIVEVIEPMYFDGPYFRYMMQNIKEMYDIYKKIPAYDTLEQKLMSETTDINRTSNRVHMDTLKSIQDHIISDPEYVKTQAMNFCRQQVLKREMKVAQKIIEDGNFQEYSRIEKIIQDALQVGATTDDIRDAFFNIRDVLDVDARVPIPTGINGIDNLLKGGLAIGELGVVIAPTGVGKAQPVSENILTPHGWEKIGNIKLGDKVIGSNGTHQYVIGIYPQGIRPIYNVKFTDGTEVNCDEEHLWSVNTLNMRTSKTRIGGKVIYRPNLGYKVIKTSEMMNDIKKRGRYNYQLPIINPIEFNHKDVLIDPYLLGLLLGDGYIPIDGNPSISTKDDELFENIKDLDLHTSFPKYFRAYQLENVITKRHINVIRLSSNIKDNLLYYNLLGKKSNNKFIPNDYLYNSIEVRLKLLQGLLDTDGYVSSTGIIQYSTASEQLAKNVREIVLSLGGTVRTSFKIPKYKYNGIIKTGQKSYMLTISFSNDIIPFNLLRKIERYRRRSKYINQKYIKSIEYSHDEDAICIKVSNPDELYVTSDYVLTHNTTLLTKFANSAYNCGYNVLHIFFEDTLNNILRKHYTIWTGISPDDQITRKEDVFEIVDQKQHESTGQLKLMKMPSDSVTISEIKSKLRKLRNEGLRIDLLVIDYVDCIVPEKSIFGEEWKSEGNVMRHLEAMTSEFDIALWVATQGNRESISSEVVTTDQIGGSIKKAQIGHVVISVGKTLDQKEHGLATISLLKSRIGRDGVIFNNCTFDNEYLVINTDTETTLLGHEERKAQIKAERTAELYIVRREREAREESKRKEREEKRKEKDTHQDVENNNNKDNNEVNN